MRSMECMPKMRDEEYGMYAQKMKNMDDAHNEIKSMECMPKMRDEDV